MLKKTKLTYKGINQDITKSKRSPDFYFDAENVRIQAIDSGTTGSITNDRGNTLIYTLPANQKIIGHAVLKDYLVLFSTNGSLDKITRVHLPDYTGFELFSGSLGFSLNNLLDTEVYYESEDIQKVYWADGLNQLRHINIITNSAYTQDQATLFNAVPEVVFSAPYVSSIDYGGIHTSGIIQYAYNLLKQNGSQSAISPISELYPLDKNIGGGKVNEYVGKILNVTIDNIDTRYDIIRLYSIKYTSYNEQPSVNIIAEETIGGNTSFKYSDDGRVIRAITGDQLTFLGGTPIIPTTITSKYNRLIMGNIKESYFDVPESSFDTRAYRFPISSLTTQIKNAADVGYTSITLSSTVATDHDCINTDFDTYKYKENSTSIGASGKYIDIEIVKTNLSDPRNLLKSGEIYRFGIEFYNKTGQTCSPKWICDLKIPDGNLNGDHNTLKVTLKNTNMLSGLGVVGWRVLRVERTDADKTILCQGIVNPSMFQNYKEKDTAFLNTTKGSLYASQGWLKCPSVFMRNNTDLEDAVVNAGGRTDSPKIKAILHGQPLNLPETPAATPEWPFPEILKHKYSDTTQNSYLDTRLVQFYSPEVTFSSMQLGENLKYRLIGGLKNVLSNCGEWCKQASTENSYKSSYTEGQLINDLRINGVISLFLTGKGRNLQDGTEPNTNGLIGGGGGSTPRMNKFQYYRKYTFDSYTGSNTLGSISGSPLIIGSGESSKVYNSNSIANPSSKYQFSNHLFTIIADRNPGDTNATDDPIISINSIGAKCINLVDNNETPFETIMSNYGLSGTGLNALVEIHREITNQYGGNTYEARSRNSYLRIGKYLPLATTINNIEQAGDIFVGQYRFERIIPNTTQILNNKYTSMCEIVEFPVETTIDINNRSDYSLDGWDAYFHPTFDEFHNYNRVYSQQSIFNRTTATPFTFQERKVFDNRINATKVKTAGEIVDSWTDVLVNEELYVDGKFGPITKIIQNNNTVYFTQEQSVGMLEIYPRVQTVSTDGTAIELGRGAVLYNYKYINTNSGCINPEGIFSSQSSIYYIDVANKSINRIIGQELAGLSDLHGLHSYMYNKLDYKTQKYSKKITGGFDQITNHAYFTTEDFTISFNEQLNTFVSRYSFKPERYIYTIYGLITTADSNSLWIHGNGDYGKYYGTTYDSTVTYVVAPEPDIDCIFNNGEFKSEVYSGSNDVFNKTIDNIRCWNEYQDSGSIDLVVGANIKRKFRDWNFFIPRNISNPLQRMRGQWLYMKVVFDNSGNNKLILHDMIVSYDAVIKE